MFFSSNFPNVRQSKNKVIVTSRITLNKLKIRTLIAFLILLLKHLVFIVTNGISFNEEDNIIYV